MCLRKDGVAEEAKVRSVDVHAGDAGLMLDSANELSVPLPLIASTQQTFRATRTTGLWDEDFCFTIRVLEDWVGLDVRRG